MKRFLATSCAIASLFAFMGPLNATMVDFDDLSGNNITIANGYGGINWGGAFKLHNDVADAHNGTNSVTSLATVASHEYILTFVHPEQIFEGAWFSTRSTSSPVNVSFNLYSGGQLVGSSSLLTVTGLSTFLDSGYWGSVDQVGVSSNANGAYFLDELDYHSAPRPLDFRAVPEPSTIALIGAGGLGLIACAIRRRFKSSKG